MTVFSSYPVPPNPPECSTTIIVTDPHPPTCTAYAIDSASTTISTNYNSSSYNRWLSLGQSVSLHCSYTDFGFTTHDAQLD